jgi:hypothetical protein
MRVRGIVNSTSWSFQYATDHVSSVKPHQSPNISMCIIFNTIIILYAMIILLLNILYDCLVLVVASTNDATNDAAQQWYP